MFLSNGFLLFVGEGSHPFDRHEQIEECYQKLVSKIDYLAITLKLSSFWAFIQVQALEDMVAENPRKSKLFGVT
jgi:hypothetical protein